MSVRRAGLAIVLCSLTGCGVTFQTLEAPPMAAVEQARGRSVRLVTRQGDTLHLANVGLQSDSVVGTTSVGSRSRMAIPLADVESLAVAEPNVVPARVLLGVALGVVLLAALIAPHLTFHE